MIKDLGTMKVLSEHVIPIDYVVLKTKGNTFSTRRNCKNMGTAMIQQVETEGIGRQNNLWLKGLFVEKGQHTILSIPVPFELNIYFKEEGIKKTRG
jgi:hypothetical protein